MSDTQPDPYIDALAAEHRNEYDEEEPMGFMTREQALASAERAGGCTGQSKLYRRGDPHSFFICTRDPGHDDPPEHTACDGHGHVIARWKTDSGLLEVWLPDGSWHLI